MKIFNNLRVTVLLKNTDTLVKVNSSFHGASSQQSEYFSNDFLMIFLNSLEGTGEAMGIEVYKKSETGALGIR